MPSLGDPDRHPQQVAASTGPPTDTWIKFCNVTEAQRVHAMRTGANRLDGHLTGSQRRERSGQLDRAGRIEVIQPAGEPRRGGNLHRVGADVGQTNEHADVDPIRLRTTIPEQVYLRHSSRSRGNAERRNLRPGQRIRSKLVDDQHNLAGGPGPVDASTANSPVNNSRACKALSVISRTGSGPSRSWPDWLCGNHFSHSQAARS